ncbi:MAG: PCRF domain-containing protein, partial [Muribaculaceae bacterium]|nr:PCRF domain-containing protein [Muribaculaceae bacterium]
MSDLLSRLDGIDERFEEVSTLITDPAVIADMKRYVALTKEYKELEKLTQTVGRYRTLLANRAEAKEVLETEKDDELRALAREEIDAADQAIPALEEEIKLLLIP